MTESQKRKIALLRSKSKSYAHISSALGISENTIKSYCRRNKLGADFIKTLQKPGESICENCSNPITSALRAKRKRFCSDKCRMLWWKANPECINQMAIYNFTCARCGTGFSSYGNKGRKYCSHACYVAARFGKEAVK